MLGVEARGIDDGAIVDKFLTGTRCLMDLCQFEVRVP